MSKISTIPVKYRGGFRGSYIDTTQLIDSRVKFDVLDFKKEEKSNVRNCEFYCRMQLRIAGVLCITWHSSEVLTCFLEDCLAHRMMLFRQVTKNLEECLKKHSVIKGNGYDYTAGYPKQLVFNL